VVPATVSRSGYFPSFSLFSQGNTRRAGDVHDHSSHKVVPIKEINLIIIEFICNIFVILMKYGELSRPCVDIMLGGLLYIPSFNLPSPTCSVEMDFSWAVETIDCPWKLIFRGG
jgi:hypothetical protein